LVGWVRFPERRKQLLGILAVVFSGENTLTAVSLVGFATVQLKLTTVVVVVRALDHRISK
jgi:hypothetical protein